MPLVTRQVNQSNVFKQATEPTEWLNGDMWIDTDTSIVRVNLNGTALNISAGTLNQGDTLFSDSDESLAALAKGTALQLLTMNAGATAPEWAAAAAAGSLEFLDNHVATTTESSYTFTPSAALDLVSTYSAIICYFGGTPTAGFQLNMQLNGITTGDYGRLVVKNLTGTITGISGAGANNLIICESGIINAANEEFWGFLVIQLAGEDGGSQRLVTTSSVNVLGRGTSIAGCFVDSGNEVDVDAIKIIASTSTWKSGMYMVTLGVKRS